MLRAQSPVQNDHIATNQTAQTCQSHAQCLFNVSATSNIPWLSFEQCLLDTVSCTKMIGLSQFLRSEYVSELNSDSMLKLFYPSSCIWYKMEFYVPCIPTKKMLTYQQAKNAPSSNAPQVFLTVAGIIDIDYQLRREQKYRIYNVCEDISFES